MNKIVIFRRKSETPASKTPAIARVLQFQPRPARPALSLMLRATWRREPASGTLECRWVREREAKFEEGASRRRCSIVGRAAIAARRASSLSR